MPRGGQQHVSWGDLQVHHVARVTNVLDEHETMCPSDKITGNTKLHRLARSDDCLTANRMIDETQNVRRLVEAKNISGSTPLHVAAYYGSRDMIHLLMENGAKPLNKNKHGWHACHYASRWSQPLDVRLAVGLKPCSPSTNSSRFTFRKIREMRKVQPEETVEKRKKLLASDSGISVCGSMDSLKIQTV